MARSHGNITGVNTGVDQILLVLTSVARNHDQKREAVARSHGNITWREATGILLVLTSMTRSHDITGVDQRDA